MTTRTRLGGTTGHKMVQTEEVSRSRMGRRRWRTGMDGRPDWADWGGAREHEDWEVDKMQWKKEKKDLKEKDKAEKKEKKRITIPDKLYGDWPEIHSH
eukprot:g28390.t1